MVRYTAVLLVGCGASSGEYSAACKQGCEEYQDGEADCSAELKACMDSCAEVTRDMDGVCAACITSDGLDGPYPSDNACEAAEFDTSACADVC